MKLRYLLALLAAGFVGAITWLLYDPAPLPRGAAAVEFETALASQQPVLVEFYADWCPPCKQVAPEVAQLAKEMSGRAHVLKLNVDHYPDMAKRYGVRAIPTFVSFHHGKETARQTGAISRQAMRQMLGL